MSKQPGLSLFDKHLICLGCILTRRHQQHCSDIANLQQNMPQLPKILTTVGLCGSIISVALSPLMHAIANPPTSPLKKGHTLSPNSKSEKHYIERGRKYSHLREFQKAVENYSAAIKLFPRSCEAYCLRAQAYCDLGQYQRQIDDLTSAITLHPKVTALYERRVDVYYKRLGQLEKAIDDAIIATKLNPTSSNGLRSAAAVFEELGLYDKAVEFRTKLISLMTNGALDWNDRAKNYELLGKLALAQADRKKATELATPSEWVTMQLCNPLTDLCESIGEGSKKVIDKQLKCSPVVLSFHYDSGGKICVPVQVNGQPLKLMLDTGCEHSDLWKKAMPGVARTDKAELGKTKNGEDYQSGFFRLKKLKLGNLTLTNVPMAVDEGLDDHKTLSGFLGGNILENFVVTIDYSKKQLILAASRHRASNEIVVPMRIRHHRPYCTVRLNGKLDIAALVDTGSTRNLSADSLLKPILSKKLIYTHVVSGPWLGTIPGSYVRLKSLAVGSSNMERPIFSVFPAEGAQHAATEITLGNSFLSRFKTVTFDYPARQIILEPNNQGTAPSALSLIEEGHFYSAHKQERRAVDAFAQAMLLDNDLAVSCNLYRALSFMYQKQYKQAILALDALIILDPKYLRAYQYRAKCHRNLGEYARQIADDSELIRLEPSHYPAYRDRAWAYDKLGEHKQADQDRRTASKVYLKWIDQWNSESNTNLRRSGDEGK